MYDKLFHVLTGHRVRTYFDPKVHEDRASLLRLFSVLDALDGLPSDHYAALRNEGLDHFEAGAVYAAWRETAEIRRGG